MAQCLIHQASERGRSAFVPLDCQALPADHLEATLKRLSDERSEESLQPGTVYLEHVEALPRKLQYRITEE